MKYQKRANHLYFDSSRVIAEAKLSSCGSTFLEDVWACAELFISL